MIHWGILGAGKIAHRFAASLQHEKNSHLYAIALRNETKAYAFQAQFPCEKIYLDFDAFLQDDKIDCIYLALPHGLHKKWAIKAMKQGKHVLCEKPAALSKQEVEEIMAVSKETGCLFMEAMKTRFVPAYKEVKNLVSKGVIGEIKRVETSFCGVIPKEVLESSYLKNPNEGGALLDTGIYCASWLEDFLGTGLVLDKLEADIEGVESYVKATLSFDDKIGILETAFDREKPRGVTLYGTKGKINVDEPHRPQTITLTTNQKSSTFTLPYDHDDFYSQIEHFVGLLKAGKKESDIMCLGATLRCAEILDEIRLGFMKGTSQ